MSAAPGGHPRSKTARRPCHPAPPPMPPGCCWRTTSPPTVLTECHGTLRPASCAPAAPGPWKCAAGPVQGRPGRWRQTAGPVQGQPGQRRQTARPEQGQQGRRSGYVWCVRLLCSLDTAKVMQCTACIWHASSGAAAHSAAALQWSACMQAPTSSCSALLTNGLVAAGLVATASSSAQAAGVPAATTARRSAATGVPGELGSLLRWLEERSSSQELQGHLVCEIVAEVGSCRGVGPLSRGKGPARPPPSRSALGRRQRLGELDHLSDQCPRATHPQHPSKTHHHLHLFPRRTELGPGRAVAADQPPAYPRAAALPRG